MEHARERIEEIRQQQKRMHKHSQVFAGSDSANIRSQIILALGGVAAGLTLAVIVWLAYPIVTTGHIRKIIPEAVKASHTDEIKRLSDNIVQLNGRVELLTDTVTKLEARLTRIRAIPDSINNTEESYASSSRGNMHESNEAKSAPTTDESNASIISQVSADTSKPFIPTHTVKASLNLRPAATLSSRPITTLKVGTEVQYISQSDGWYYVNTRLHGKGWCSSDYLSPLLQTQQQPSAN
jgi:hypothetical protein